MTKAEELSDPNSCLNRARPDELIFVLLARDVAAPAAIREWAKERVRLRKNYAIGDEQLISALRCADAMEKFHKRPRA